MSELAPKLKDPVPPVATAAKARVGVIDGALGADRAALEAQFPKLRFLAVDAAWSGAAGGQYDVLIVAAAASDVDGIVERLAGVAGRCPVVVALRDADLPTTRRLMDAGAADVLAWPVSAAALAACLGRLLRTDAHAAAPDGSGQIIAFLKAGGGVGATSLACQTAFHAAECGREGVCLADLDLEFGIADLFFDLPQALSIGDLLASGSSLDEAPLASALATHKSGAKLLAAPRQLTPLETLTPAHADALARSLRRELRLTFVDLPSVWTAWTNQILNRADRIVLVTRLSVPHVQLVKRQLQTLAAQELEGRPLTLVCNAVSGEQRASVSVKTAEKALGRDFDLVIPEDPGLMIEAANRGQPLSAIRRGSKTGKLVGELAQLVAGIEPVAHTARHWIW